jgi:hypothetical protein
MELIADVSGLIPSDFDAERRLVDCLIVDPHCNVTLPLEQFFDARHEKFYSLIQAMQVAGQHRERRVLEAARIENNTGEKVRVMDGRRGAPGFRVTRWAGRTVHWTNRVAWPDKTCPVGPDGHP